MSDLQWALLGSGIVAIACVWLYNVWQERKFRKSTDELFKKSGDDAPGGVAGPSSDTTELSAARGQRIEPRGDSDLGNSVGDQRRRHQRNHHGVVVGHFQRDDEGRDRRLHDAGQV